MMDSATIVLILQALGVVFILVRGYVALIRRLDRIEFKINECPHVDKTASDNIDSRPIDARYI